MSDRVTLQLVQEGDVLDAEVFASSARDFLEMLNEVASVVAPAAAGKVKWGIAELRTGSATLAFVGMGNISLRGVQDTFVATVRGMQAIEVGDAPPEYFTVGAQKALHKLVGRIGHGLKSVGVNDARTEVCLTERSFDFLERILGMVRTAPGSVEGTLESVTVHGRHSFTIWERVWGRGVHCTFEPAVLEEVRRALGKRVLVDGLIKYDPADVPTHVDVTAVTMLPDEAELPTPADLMGMDPNFTGKLSTSEYLRGLYDA